MALAPGDGIKGPAAGGKAGDAMPAISESGDPGRVNRTPRAQLGFQLSRK
jgi:hypothetical protein